MANELAMSGVRPQKIVQGFFFFLVHGKLFPVFSPGLLRLGGARSTSNRYLASAIQAYF